MGPRKAPTTIKSFASPPPMSRKPNRGRVIRKAKPNPNNPGRNSGPPGNARIARATSKLDTVSQLGMRRLRTSNAAPRAIEAIRQVVSVRSMVSSPEVAAGPCTGPAAHVRRFLVVGRLRQLGRDRLIHGLELTPEQREGGDHAEGDHGEDDGRTRRRSDRLRPSRGW